MKTENLAIIGFSIVVVYYFFMRNDKTSESSYSAKGACSCSKAGGRCTCGDENACASILGDACVSPSSARSMAPTKTYNSSKSSSRYLGIPSPNLNLVDEPLGLAQIVFGPNESDFNGRGSISNATQIPIPGGPITPPPTSCCSDWCVSAGKNKSDQWLGFCVRKHCK